MKLGTKFSLLSTLGIISIVGTGFAAWTFSEAPKSFELNNVKVVTNADVKTDATITLDPSEWHLILDEKWIGWSTSTDVEKDYQASDALTQVKPTLTLNPESSTKMEDFTLTYSMKVDETLDEYVTIGEFGGEWVSGSTISLPSVEWVEGKKPTTKAQYDAMIEAIGDVTFIFSATL